MQKISEAKNIFECDFERNDWCGLEDFLERDFQIRRNNGKTTTPLTGRVLTSPYPHLTTTMPNPRPVLALSDSGYPRAFTLTSLMTLAASLALTLALSITLL